MKRIVFPILALALALTSCKKNKNTEKDKIKLADWLIGTWENELEQGTLTETWERANDSTLSGKSFFIKDKDTLNNETIALVQNGEALFYVPTVQGQNNNQPVIFKLTKSTATQMVFENPKHDFPKKITYTQVNKDSLVAEISGIENGKPASEQYPMKRK